jgi:hypothetical protein
MFEIHYNYFHSNPITIDRQFKEKNKIVSLLNYITKAGYEYPLKQVNRYILYTMFQALRKIPNLTLILVNIKTQDAITFSCFEKNIIIRTGSVIDKIYGDRQEVKLNDIKNLDILSNNNNSLFNCGVKSSLTLSYKDEFKITI